MNNTYKEEAFELFEEILIKYNKYSQITIKVFTLYKKTLQEFFEEYASTHYGSVHDIFSCLVEFNFELEIEWVRSLSKLKEKYKIYPI